MRRFGKVRKGVSAFTCAAAFLLAAPRMLRSPQPPALGGTQSCKLVLGHGTPAKPEPHECWRAVASWYGPQFEGQSTANGASFNMYAPTAAHRSLPLGSIVRVSNPSTGRSMVVTINDRGPFVPGRGLDVSYGVARMLGFAQQGVCHVEVELLQLPGSRWFSSRPED